MDKVTTSHCNTCGGERNHKILFQETSEWSELDHLLWGPEKWEILKCCGCAALGFRKTSSSHDGDPESVEVAYYPPANLRPEPLWIGVELGFGRDQSIVRKLLRQIYCAVENELYALAAMGVRALLEHIMVSTCGDQRSFVENLNKFESEGYVSAKQRERLETILEVGHAVIHRAYFPDATAITILVDITESIVESVYIHGPQVHSLKATVPARQPRRKA